MGCCKGVGCVSRKRGCWALQEAEEGGQDKTAYHSWGLVWETTPRGADGVHGAAAVAAAAVGEEEKQPQPGLGVKAAQTGEGAGSLEGGSGRTRSSRTPGNCPRMGKGVGTGPGKGKDNAVGGPLPLPTGPTSPVSPLQQRQQRRGWGYQTPELLPPSAELPNLSSSSGSLPAPLSLREDGEAGRGLLAPRAPSPRTA